MSVAIGELSEVDLPGYATMASTMLRIRSRLGLSRRPREVGQSLAEFIESGSWTCDEERTAQEPIGAQTVGGQP
jgi:hypothetical protein